MIAQTYFNKRLITFSKNTKNIMKKTFKIIGIVVGSILTILLILGLYINFKGIPKYEVKEISVNIPPADSATLAHGKKLAQMVCAGCHLSEGKLQGKKMVDVPATFGEIYSQNITGHPTKGIGRYSDAELVHFLRTGIKKDGRHSFVMGGYPLMSDADLHYIVAFLRSDDPLLEPVDEVQPPTKPSFLVKALTNTVIKPMPYPEQEILAPPTSDQLAYGEYLADGLLGCFHCHSADFTKIDPLNPKESLGFYGGGNTILDPNDGSEVLSANLTPHETGLKGWTLEEFSNAVRFGKKQDGTAMTAAMPPHPELNEGEVAAIWVYLQSIPAIDNSIQRAVTQ
jgi:mono/diheme cytochrome c family protein